MRVPTVINPRTRPLGRPEQFSRASASPEAFGAGLVEPLRGITQQLREDQLRQQEFDASKTYVQEIVELKEDFENRKGTMPEGGEGFADSVNADYAKRHEALIADMRGRGVDEEIVNDTSLRLQQLRGNIGLEALSHQTRAYEIKVNADLDKSENNLLSLTLQNPDLAAGAVLEYKGILAASGLPADQQRARLDKFEIDTTVAKAVSKINGGQALDILRALGGEDELTVLEATGKVKNSETISPPAQGTVTGKFGDSRPGHIHNGVDIAGPQGTPIGAPASGVISFAAKKGENGNLVIVKHADGKESRLAHLHNISVRPGQEVSKGEPVGGMGSTGRSTGPHVHWSLYENGKPIDPMAANEVRAVAPPREVSVEAQVSEEYNNIPFAQRLQLIGMAQRKIEEGQQVEYAQTRQAYEDQYNSLMVRLLDGKGGQADVDAARDAGWLEDFQDIERANSVVEARAKKNADINLFNAMISEPGMVWNRFDPEQQKAVNAGVEARGGTLEAAMNLWERTGILATGAQIALRGGLISTDPKQVQAAANVAGNMLRKDPRAFAGVKGGPELEKAALSFNHKVYDMGFSPEDAANQIAIENSPEFRAKVAVGEPQIDELRRKIKREGLDVSDLVFDDAKFETPQLQTIATNAYAELVIDNMRDGKRESEARAIAKEQLKKIYGVSRDGRVMQYPPELGYPKIGGSHDYIYKQAAQSVKDTLEIEVEIGDVRLVPILRVTDDNFRNNQAPRYSVVYSYQVDGQTITDIAPQPFYADTAGPAAEVFAQQKADIAFKHASQFGPTRLKLTQANPRRPEESRSEWNKRIDALYQKSIADREARMKRTRPGTTKAKQQKETAALRKQVLFNEFETIGP